ncbi:MAG: M14 family zinc carboxypeptidase [Gemmatimonadota bacterium]
MTLTLLTLLVGVLPLLGALPMPAAARQALGPQMDDPPAQVRHELTTLRAAQGIAADMALRIDDLLATVAGASTPAGLRNAARHADAIGAGLAESVQQPLRIALDSMAEYLRLRAVFGNAWACVEFPESQGNQDFSAYHQPWEVDSEVRLVGARDGVRTEIIGTTLRGRPIHAVRVGTGDRVVFVQAGIHGNEATGTTAVINLLNELSDGSDRSRQIREALTVVAIPMLNPDGAAHYQRANDQTWEETVALFPQLGAAAEAFHHSLPGPRFWGDPRVAGYDVNRDFSPDFTDLPQPGDLPGTSSATGLYLTAEARASRDLYAALESEFGLVDVFIDLHNQAPCNTFDHDGDPATPARYTPMSISAQMIRDPVARGAGTEYPNFDWDASRRANVAAWQALQELGAPYANITRYPQNLDLAGSAVAAYQLRGSAGVLMEASRQRNSTPAWRLDFLVEVHQRAIRGIIDALADAALSSIDPDLYDAIPVRN